MDVIIFLTLVVLAILQFILIKIKSSNIEYLTNLSKTKELMQYLNNGCITYVDAHAKNILMIACSEKTFFIKKRDIGREYTFLDVIKKCIGLGFDVNEKTSQSQNTALHYCLQHEYNTDIVDYLVNAGADMNAININGRTPLFAVCRSGYVRNYERIKHLVNNINHQDKNGYTPLMVAAANGNTFIVNDLLGGGANVHITNDRGQNAYDVAVSNKSNNIKLGGINTATGVDAYGKHNHAINQMIERLYCEVNGKKFRPTKYKQRSHSAEL